MKTIQKQHQIVLVPTDKESVLFKYDNTIHFTANRTTYKAEGKFGTQQPQHLYILSDEEIKESDWQVKYSGNGRIGIGQHQLNVKYSINPKKIIATTNPELIRQDEKLSKAYNTKVNSEFSKPTDQFIQQWIDKGCPEFINVEYEEIDHHIKPILKISSDNTINCSLIENETYTKQEVIHLLKKASKFGIYEDEYMDDWIKENK